MSLPIKKPRWSLHHEAKKFWELTDNLTKAKLAGDWYEAAWMLEYIDDFTTIEPGRVDSAALRSAAQRTIQANVGTLASLKEMISDVWLPGRGALMGVWRLVPPARWGSAEMRRLAIDCLMALCNAKDRPFAVRGAYAVLSHLRTVGVLPRDAYPAPVVLPMNETGIVDLRSLKPTDQVELFIDHPASYRALRQIGEIAPENHAGGDGAAPHSRWWFYLDRSLCVAKARRIVKILDRDGPPTKDRYPVEIVVC
jgi:hypothetical protein